MEDGRGHGRGGRARREWSTARRTIGDGWVFPADDTATAPTSRYVFLHWWERAEKAAKLEHVKGRGWHSLRRKFATELKETPLKDLCYLGEWKEPTTVLSCYQQPDQATMQAALEKRRLRVVAAK